MGGVCSHCSHDPVEEQELEIFMNKPVRVDWPGRAIEDTVVGYKVAFSEGYVFACSSIGIYIIACPIISRASGDSGRHACMPRFRWIGQVQN